ncbi:MAG: TetR/AcrR family transcriptional regulator [Phototrophicaceae bacterium]
MPYPSQIDRDTIISTARQMIEDEGVDNLSLRSLAESLGVKAPSLYRYVKNKTALLRAVNDRTTREMMQHLYAAADPTLNTHDRLLAICHTFREFVHDNPACYLLSANTPLDETRPDAAEREALVIPLQGIFAEMMPESETLPALRGAYAFIHGWVMLEIMEQFERGGDLDAHFERALRAYLAGW